MHVTRGEAWPVSCVCFGYDQRSKARIAGSGVDETDSERVSVLIVEDEWIVARGVQQTLETAGFVVSNVAASAAEALSAVAQARPDLALVDIVIQGPVDGVDLACQLRELHDIPSVFLTAHADQHTMQRALRAAPLGYVVKPFQETQLLSSVRVAAAALNGAAVSVRPADSAPATPIVSDDAPPSSDLRTGQFREVARVIDDWVPSRASGRHVLTPRELEVVRLLLANGRVVSIAEELGVSPYTIRNHLRSIYRKLGVHSQVELIRKLTQHRVSDEGSRAPEPAIRR